MRLKAILAAVVVGGAFYHAGGPATMWAAPATNASDTVLLASTNDLLRILRAATNAPAIDAAWKRYRKSTVVMDRRGSLEARYDVVSVFSTNYELLSKLAECLADSTVRVREQRDGSLLYVKDSRNKFLIRVIHDECDAHHFEGVYHLRGDRGFFTVEALLHLESRPDPHGGIEYVVHVYANSSSRILNLLVKIPFVRKYFAAEIEDVVAKFDAVYADMLETPRENLRKVMQLRDPKGPVFFSDRDIDIVTRVVDMLDVPSAPESRRNRSDQYFTEHP